MGYTLYWRRPVEIDKATFEEIVVDFRATLPYLKKMRVKLAGIDGYGEPRIDAHGVCFNGAVRCGHRCSMPDVWGALAELGAEANHDQLEVKRGRKLRSRNGRAKTANLDWEMRRCPGSCAFETFLFPRVNWDPRRDLLGLWDSCKTNRRFYELAIQVWLIAAKYHMGHDLSLEGNEEHWADARKLCQKHLGYGQEIRLFEPAQASKSA